MMRLTGLVLATLIANSPFIHAQLDEKGFQNYTEGDLLGQHGWQAQGREQGRPYTNMTGRVSIKVDPATGNRWVAWHEGFEPASQSRILKRFPATVGSKVVVKLDIRPGKATIPGQFIFDYERTGGTSIRFDRGTLRVANHESPRPVDSKVSFYADDWNHVELHFNFETYQLQAYLNGRNAGLYALPPNMNGINEFNFFGGGIDFETGLDNLSIELVETFTAPSLN